MKTSIFVIVTLLLFSLQSCEKKKESASSDEISLDSSSFSAMSSSAAMISTDTSKKFIKTADLKFKVKNVRGSTFSIEEVIQNNGGFITHTHLRSENVYQKEYPISRDSSIKLTQFRLVNDLEFKIPSSKLHATLVAIGNHATFIDYRTIDANEVSLQLFQNSLKYKRLGKQSRRLNGRIDNRNGNVLETTDAEAHLMQKEEEQDNVLIQQNTMLSDIEYSTVKIYFYEENNLLKETLVLSNSIENYSPGFMQKASVNLTEGFKTAEEIIFFFLKNWAILLVIGGLLVGLYKLKQNFKIR